nr:hypothetical protein [Tanacetum cinerariifolium]
HQLDHPPSEKPVQRVQLRVMTVDPSDYRQSEERRKMPDMHRG